MPDIKKDGAAVSATSREQRMEQLRSFLSSLLPPLGAKADSEGEAEPETGSEFSLNFVFTSPEIKKPSLDKPVHIDISKDFAEFKADIIRDGQTVRGKVLLNLRTREVPGGKSDDYGAFVTAISDSIASLSSKSDSTAAAKSDSVANSETKTIAPVTTFKNSDVPSVEHRSEVIDLYKLGQDEAKQHNYANAVESFNSALRLAPQYPEAWRELGRAQMYLRNYTEAETALRKYLALAPDDRLAYMNMAWVLSTEKKYADDVEMLEKRIADSPNDGDANARLGEAYLALHQPDKALPVLQKAVSIFPKYEYPQFNLARAYLQLHQDDRAAAEFQRAIKLDDTSNTRNSAAYDLAEAKTHLETAAMWANNAIDAVELEVNQAKLPIQTATLPRVSQLAAYWDTMGWIRFQQGDLSTAEKYIRASSELADDSTILMHLGKIYEAQKRQEQAIEAYAEALASVPTTREMDEDEKEARTRFVALLGNESFVEGKVKQSRAKIRERRSVSISNPAGLEGITQYILIIGPGSKVMDLQAVSSDDSLTGLKDALRSATMPQSFPDNMAQKLPRAGTLSCPRAEAPCTFTLNSAGAASQVMSTD